MLVGDQDQTSTKQPMGYIRWKMVWWVKGLMNHPTLKVATNVGLYYAHKKGGHEILKWNRIHCYRTIRTCPNPKGK
jgi:hypothetical protein